MIMMMMTTTIEQNDDNDDFFADISILLEGNLPSTVKHFEFAFIPTTTRSSSSSSPPPTTKTTTSVVENKSITKSTTKRRRRRRTIHVDLHVVDDDPGSIRSGHYLWDAAPALCDYLIHQHHHHCHLSSQQQLPPLHECQQQPAPTTPLVAPQSIIELGAGCGLPSLVALQLYAQSIQCLIVSDRDPTVLERARNSYESTMEKLMHKEKDDNDDDDNDDDDEEEEEDGQELVLDCRDQLGSIPVAFETLEWGCHNDIHHRQQSYSFLDGSPHIKNLLSSTNNRRRYETGRGIISDDKNNYLTIDLILGSDLIDCIEIVEPLFHTAYDLMHDESILILSQSFLYDSETEAKIQEICNELLLERIIRYDNLSKKLEEMQVPLKVEEDATTNNRNEGVDICSGRNNSNENDETRTLLPGGGRHRIQEFKRRRK